MTSRLDRLLVLLDTGSSSNVRQTAAKQLAELAAKSVIGDVKIEEDVKNVRSDIPRADIAAWAELMSVIGRILPFLHSKSHETRTAASTTLSNICSLVPSWRPLEKGATQAKHDTDVKMEDGAQDETIPRSAPEFPQFSVRELLEKGTLLLSSSGKEFVKPANLLANPAEVKKARKAAMSRLGLDFLDAVDDDDGMDWEKELADDQDMDVTIPTPDIKVEVEPVAPIPIVATSSKNAMERSPSSDPSTSSTPALPAEAAPTEDVAGMSARERNRLKRKRKGGASAFVAAPPPPTTSNPKYNASASGAGGSKIRLIDKAESPPLSRSTSPMSTADGAPEKVVIDPSKGGAVNPKAAEQSKALQVLPGCWPWEGLVKILQVDLYHPAWEARHGSAMALREILKTQGHAGGMKDELATEDNAYGHERWCNDLASQILCIFVLDRFGDFVSDQVVAPVRETVSQTLASLLIHMPRRSVFHTHAVLLQMVRQDFPVPPPARQFTPMASNRRMNKNVNVTKDPTHIWEVRHAGLLGIKYEVAVRPDLVSEPVKADEGVVVSQAALRDVVDAAVLGLGDRDDDVRSVAASCLLPVAKHVVSLIPEVLPQVLAVLWSGLTDMKDDLSSSVGTVMDLLGVLVSHDTVIEILADDQRSSSINVLAPSLYPFFRHTIPDVRLAVVRTLQSFMVVPSLAKDWVDVPFLCLLFQNLAVEENLNIREATLAAWKTALQVLDQTMSAIVSQQLILQWYEIAMTPLGTPINTMVFFVPETSVDGERHNVDKPMLLQDLALVSMESILKARIAAVTGLAQLLVYWPDSDGFDDLFRPFLTHYIESASMLQKFLSAVVVEEWAKGHAERSSEPLLEKSALARDQGTTLLSWLQSEPPIAYHEMVFLLSRLHLDCYNLLHSFVTDCKIGIACIPQLGSEIDPTGNNPACFTVHKAREAVGSMFNTLKNSLGRTKKKELAVISERRNTIADNIDRFHDTKAEYDVRISASFAAAYIALRATPEKVSPIVKGIMNGVKGEANIDIQTRSAMAVANFVGFCEQYNIKQPPEKIVKNLCTFLCQDTERTPTFASTHKQEAGILSFQALAKEAQSNGNGKAPEKVETTPEMVKARLSGRGASLAFNQLSSLFGSRLLTIIPGMWQSMVGGLLSACSTDSHTDADKLMAKSFGQDVIDSLSVLDAVVPALHADLHPQILDLLPMLLVALRSRFAIIRQSAARCLATICDVVTVEGMRFVIEKVIPLLGDPLSLSNRQGSAELIYHIVQKLDIKALPYILFMIVPVLGRMSDPDDDVRATTTNAFASLVKMVPLEAGLPDPPGFSDEMLARRETERQFLTQLLDGKKVEQYTIPVAVNAELRSYQQEGVNWLAFLAKYQLHGILCDDMGLGKTLQSICIVAGKHFERAEKFKATKSPDAVHLPSLIVCPPTLTGHWYHEILKYANNLRPLMYVGNARERTKLASKLQSFDVVITSYEVVRNDIASLANVAWHYCILDEGHIIKNAKTKLTKAVKQVRANHRLILSGTPIQNNVLELWSLFDFLMPGFLGSEQSFNERFSKPILANRDGKAKNPEAAALALEALHKQVLPFLLRRLKEDVLHDLPPKIIQDYYCDLSDLQKQLYDDFSSSTAATAAEAEVEAPARTSASEKDGQPHVFQSLQYLRKLCNHPALVLKDNQAATAEAMQKAGITGKPDLSDINHAPKLLALKQLLNDCGIGISAAPGEGKGKDSDEAGLSEIAEPAPAFAQHRALVFCQMKQMLDIIENDLLRPHLPGVSYMRLDGSTDATKRHAVVQTFNADPSIDILLLTTHVGGLGLTLTGADTVIFVEHDWNPMKDMQAMDRAHRIGQKKVVNVYRLITKGTLEEKIMGLQRFKLNIANSVVTQQNSGLASMDTDLVLDLFKRTTDEEDAAAKKKARAKEASGPASQKNVLQGLEDLPPEEEYSGLDLSSFMSSLGR